MTTTVTIVFDGPDHEKAADAYIVQWSDGGMDQDVEQRLEGQGFPVKDSDFDQKTRTITIKL